MATIKYDVSDVESGGGGQEPKPGLYSGKIISVTHRDKNRGGQAVDDLEVVVNIGPEYANKWTYVTLDSPAARWKVREFLDAVGLPPKGELTPQKLKSLAGKPVLVRIRADKNLDDDYQGKIKNLFMPGTVDDEEVIESGNGTETDDDDMESWTDDDLKAELADRGLKIGRFNREKAIAALSETEEEEEPEGEDEDDEEEATAATTDIDPELKNDLSVDPEFYAEWPDEDVKSYVEDLGIKGNISGRYSRANGVKAIVALAESILGPSDDTPEGSEDEYDSWDEDDLLGEIEARAEQGVEIKISGRKTKDKMIKALRADDAKADPF